MLAVWILLKLLLVPALVYLAALATRRWGTKAQDWLPAFPLLAAPILVILAMDLGPAFAASAALAAVLGILGVLVFALAYIWTARTRPWPDSLLVALCCYALALLGLRQLQADLALAGVSALVALLVAPLALPAAQRWVRGRANEQSTLYWCLGLSLGLTALLTLAAPQLGARVVGLLAMAPVLLAAAVVLAHRGSGLEYAGLRLRSAVRELYAALAWCVAFALLLPYGLVLSVCASTLLAAAVHVLVRRLIKA